MPNILPCERFGLTVRRRVRLHTSGLPGPRWRLTASAVFAAIALSLPLRVLAADLPDPNETPGKVNPAVNQSNIDSTICVPGYTKTIRPPAYYTTTLKKQQLKQKKYTDKKPADYEEDHLISLEIGGHPKDPANLWPQSYNGQWNARVKDQLENKLHDMVCAGDIKLLDAQRKISEDWIAAYQEIFGADQ